MGFDLVRVTYVTRRRRTGCILFTPLFSVRHLWNCMHTSVCNPESRDPGRFHQSRIPGLAASQSRDYGITKICQKCTFL